MPIDLYDYSARFVVTEHATEHPDGEPFIALAYGSVTAMVDGRLCAHVPRQCLAARLLRRRPGVETIGITPAVVEFAFSAGTFEALIEILQPVQLPARSLRERLAEAR